MRTSPRFYFIIAKRKTMGSGSTESNWKHPVNWDDAEKAARAFMERGGHVRDTMRVLRDKLMTALDRMRELHDGNVSVALSQTQERKGRPLPKMDQMVEAQVMTMLYGNAVKEADEAEAAIRDLVHRYEGLEAAVFETGMVFGRLLFDDRAGDHPYLQGLYEEGGIAAVQAYGSEVARAYLCKCDEGAEGKEDTLDGFATRCAKEDYFGVVKPGD